MLYTDIQKFSPLEKVQFNFGNNQSEGTSGQVRQIFRISPFAESSSNSFKSRMKFFDEALKGTYPSPTHTLQSADPEDLGENKKPHKNSQKLKYLPMSQMSQQLPEENITQGIR